MPLAPPTPGIPATCGLIRIDFNFYLDIFRVAQVIIIVRLLWRGGALTKDDVIEFATLFPPPPYSIPLGIVCPVLAEIISSVGVT